MQKSGSKSFGSLRTISTAASEETAEALLRGDKQAAHYRGVLVWAKTHKASLVISGETDHKDMKIVRKSKFMVHIMYLDV